MSEVYKNPLIQIELSQKPCTKGHIVIKSSKKINKFNELQDLEITQLFNASSISAKGLFELLGAHGTNIILTELPEKDLVIDVIARKENDGLSFQWQPTDSNPEELKSVAKEIKDNVDKIKWEWEHPDSGEVKEQVKEEIKSEEGKKNYLLKSLNRTP